MELRWMEDFIALARTQHFSRAAEEQNVTQPTFSRRIKLLEEEMGTTLINRQTLPLTLTPAGAEFLKLCEQVTERVRLTRERLNRMTSEQASRLLIAAPQSLLTHFLPHWMTNQPQLARLQPYLRATGWLIADYFQGLACGECDLALCYWPVGRCDIDIDVSEYQYLIVGREHLIPCSAPGEHGAPRFRLPGTKRHSQAWIAYHPRGLLSAAIASHLARMPEATHLTVLNETIQTNNVKELVSLGYGLGWLPARVAKPALDQGQLVRAGDERWDIPLQLRLYRLAGTQRYELDKLWSQIASSSEVTPGASE
ncbi:LysR family transcriptional regulator [Aidingimonas halophila]|uniref:Transcriptional regulator, LysR family n=1 Tax=Aidingimonas halophila TaxID=574349 RepID=A0A1H3BMW1_9GAMM|nr:LysR family transcriptional regulator [Aidingimonas halophila]GHC26833.1 LysR family transcriptional regulator [Aidingimonas halophila]SDX43256.1 transcriptional regulator, LysR family [Aidingimonas halophila]